MNLPTRPKFAFFDFAYTIVPSYFVSTFNVYFCKNHLTERFESISRDNEILMEKSRNNEVTYNQVVDQVNRTFCELLKGQDVDFVAECVREFEKDFRIFDYVKPVFEYLYEKGFAIKILTADCDFMIQPLLDKLPQGFEVYPSKMEIADGKFTGVMTLLHNSKFKLDTVREIENTVKNALTIGFGDSEGDMPMLEACDLGFFVNEKEAEYQKNVNTPSIVHIANPDSMASVEKIQTAIQKLL